MDRGDEAAKEYRAETGDQPGDQCEDDRMNEAVARYRRGIGRVSLTCVAAL